MVDQRIKRLAEILVNYSIKVKKNSIIALNFEIDAKDLALECYKLILQKEAFPVVNSSVPGFSYQYYQLATEEMLKKKPEIELFKAKKTDGTISIGAEYNTREFTNVDPKKISLRARVNKPISDIVLKKNNWVICEYPTHSLAQEAELSLDEMEDFVYNACLLDWKKESRKQDKLKKIIDKGKVVRIIGENTDIKFSIKGRQGIKCDGHRNMPDGEVFCAPVETSTSGYIQYTFPAIKNGVAVPDVRLEFKNGKVIKAKASKNEGYLRQMIKTDKGACMLGEFGIGLNFGIKKFIRNILFDEKIGGTIHLALGMAYKEGHGRNESALHWDMIKDLRNNGKIIVDGKVIQQDGKWLI